MVATSAWFVNAQADYFWGVILAFQNTGISVVMSLHMAVRRSCSAIRSPAVETVSTAYVHLHMRWDTC
eukprot:1144911-Pelagomonas_calceolata.AAC.3